MIKPRIKLRNINDLSMNSFNANDVGSEKGSICYENDSDSESDAESSWKYDLNEEDLSSSDVIRHVQCAACSEVPRPENIKRFLCQDNQHPLCEECSKKGCNCASIVSSVPSKLMQNLVQLMPWYCKNYKYGCRATFRSTIALSKHESNQGSGNTIFNCFVGGCRVKSCSVLGVIHHFSKHGILEVAQMKRSIWSSGQLNNILDLPIRICKAEENRWLLPRPLVTPPSFKSKFFLSGSYQEGCLRIWLQILGTCEDAKKYGYSITAKSKTGKFSYEGMPSPCEMKEDPRYNIQIGNQCGLFISKQVLESCEKGRLALHITMKRNPQC